MESSMNILSRIVLCCVIFITGCTGYMKQAHERAVCKQSCQIRLLQCNKACINNCPHCCLSANQRTARSYQHYLHQQDVQGIQDMRELNSYRDPLQCRKTNCDCPTDYRTCIQTCTGKIPKRLQKAPVC